MIRGASRVWSGSTARSVRAVADELVSVSRNPKGVVSRLQRTMATKVITPENLNPHLVKLEYAVRGPLVNRATEIEKELQKVRFFI